METNVPKTTETIGTIKQSAAHVFGERDTRIEPGQETISGINKDRGPLNWSQNWDKVPNPKLISQAQE